MSNDYYNVGETVNRYTLARAEVVQSELNAISTGFGRLPSLDNLRRGMVGYCVDTGSENTVVVAMPATATAYVEGMIVRVKIKVTNTGAATINIDGLGAVAIKTLTGVDPAAGDLVADEIYELQRTGSVFSMTSAARSYVTQAAGSATAAAASASSAASSASTASGAATTATNARDSILNDAGFQAVSADLTGDDDIGTVADDIANVNTVAGDIADVSSVAGSIASINTVAGDIANVNAVGADLLGDDNIGTVVANLTDIQNAEENATLAKNYATAAEDTEVEPGEYSAYHWAQKAAEFAGGSAVNISVDQTDLDNFAGADVQAALEDIDAKAAYLAGGNAFTGSNTFNGELALAASGGQFATLTADADDLSLNSSENYLRINGNGWELTGLTGGEDGRIVILQNQDSSDTLILKNETSSASGNRFRLPNNKDITMPSGVSVVLRYEASRWEVIAQSFSTGTDEGDLVQVGAGGQLPALGGRNLSSAPYHPGFVYNARVTINSTDSEHDLDIPQFSLRNDANTRNLDAGSSLTKKLDSTFDEGTDAGGMAAGESLPASDDVYIFAVTKDADGTVDVMGDTSPAGANINAGWTAERLLAIVRTDASANISAITNYWVAGDFIFKSEPLNITASGGFVSVNHHLGAEDLAVTVYLQCVSAEFGYGVGDIVQHSNQTSDAGSNNIGSAVIIDGSSVSLRFGSHSSVTFIIPRKDTGVSALLTNSSWKIVARAKL